MDNSNEPCDFLNEQNRGLGPQGWGTKGGTDNVET
jgi:hypothetical protein